MRGRYKRRTLYLATITLLIVGMAAGYYFGYYMPQRQDVAYNASLARATNVLVDDAKHLLDTASLPMFNDLNELPATCEDNAAKVTQAVSQFNDYLSELERIANASQPAYIYDLGRDGVKTKARKIRADAMVKQSRQVLMDYTAMVTFLSDIAGIREGYVSIASPFTTTVDVYDYFYRTEELRADAAAIDALASRVLSIKAPLELATIQAGIATQYKETAVGYRALADALTLGNEAGVYVAARHIEDAMAQLDNGLQAQYADAMSQSVVMKELSELPDKYVIE